jgi:hypothetical protein
MLGHSPSSGNQKRIFSGAILGSGKRFVMRADEKLTAFVEPNRCRCFSRRESFSLQNGYQFVPLDARDPELTFTKTIL